MVVRSFCSRFIMYCRLELFCKKASLKIFSTQGQTPSVESYLEKMATLSEVLSCESCKLFQDNQPLNYLWTAASMSRSFFILISIYNLYVSSIHDLFSSIGVANWNHIHESSNFTQTEFNRRCFPEKFPRFPDLWLLLVVATDRIAKKVSVEETSDVFWNTYNNYDISIFPGFLTRFGSLCLPEYHMLYYIIYWVSFYSF